MGTRNKGNASGTLLIVTERRRQAVALRTAGLTFDQIGKQLGVSVRTAFLDVTKELDKLRKDLSESVEALRELELRRLDRAMVALHEQVGKGNHGAIDRMIRIMERRAKLLGLDKPVEIINEHRFTPESGQAFLKAFYQTAADADTDPE